MGDQVMYTGDPGGDPDSQYTGYCEEDADDGYSGEKQSHEGDIDDYGGYTF